MPVLEAQLASIMESMAYGLYIVGSRSGGGDLNGMMADWVMQVSFRPRLLAAAIENDAQTLANILDTGLFTLNLLGQDRAGMALAQAFAQPYRDAKIQGRGRPRRLSFHDKLDGLAYGLSAGGCPVLDAAIAWTEWEAIQYLTVGDHTLVVGCAIDGRVLRDDEPLTSAYTGWLYSG
jgi:flavin reductase (DIM6/NTAB) family NADH-FMN oxidoreductase RutF